MPSLPTAFLDYISQYPQLAPLATDLLTEPSVAVRYNRAKVRNVAALDQLDYGGPVRWCGTGFYLAQRPAFTFDPALHQGLYYVQDASSMAISIALGYADSMESPIRYLDACAAPGGKTTIAIDTIAPGSLVVANEYDYKRAEVLSENLSKWGSPWCMVTRGDTKQYRRLPGFFDIVAVDAPCSGEGMMRKDPKAIEQWSPQLVNSCAAMQREILDNVWTALRPGGYLIYSTCTFNRTENEENVAWLIRELGAEPVNMYRLRSFSEVCPGIDAPPGTTCSRFLPGRVRGEGLFLTMVRKPGPRAGTMPLPAPKQGVAASVVQALSPWLVGGGWIFVQRKDDIYALPAQQAGAMAAVASHVDTVMPGLHVATIKGRDLIPTQELALSTALNVEAFARQEVDYDTAIAYLQRQAIAIADAPRGYVLLMYKGRPLGFVKNLGNRANNLYPKNWRILSQRH